MDPDRSFGGSLMLNLPCCQVSPKSRGMLRIYTVLLLLSLCLIVRAQDQHFTQFFASPLTFSPALTGSMEGKYRVSFIYRDQWRQVLDQPYTTFSAAADFRYPVGQFKRKYRDAFGVGLVFYSDRVPVTDFSTNQIMLSGAFHKALDANSVQFLSLGVQFGIVQRNINYDALTFEDEFNGDSGFNSGTSGEVLPENNFGFGDMQIGLAYSYAPARKVGLYAGVAVHHVLRPRISFFTDEENSLSGTILSSDLSRRYSAYLNLRIPVGEVVTFSPRGLIMKQGPHYMAVGGGNFRFLMDDSRDLALHLGGYIRPVQDEDEFALDSAIALLGIELNRFLLGFSFDLGIDQLRFNSRNQNAFEVSVAYLGAFEDDAVLCPKF